MGILIDSSVLISFERARVEKGEWGAHLSEEVFLSAVTASELLHGVHRANDEDVRSRRAVFVEALLDGIPILPIDLDVARTHAELWANLAARGKLIGAHDLWLAATAVTHDFAIATLNKRDFSRVPGLQVLAW